MKQSEFSWPKATSSFPTASESVHVALLIAFLSVGFITSINNNNNDQKPSQYSEPPKYPILQHSADHFLQESLVGHFLQEYWKSNGHQNIYIRKASFRQRARSHNALCHFLIYYNYRPYLHSSLTLAVKACPFPQRETTSQGCHFKVPFKVRILFPFMQYI